MNAYHEVRDAEKLQALVASMEANGWQGAPLVAYDYDLFTGSHRHAAWMQVHGDDYGIPTIQVRDVFEDDGLDFDAILEEEFSQGYGPDVTWVYVFDHLSAEIIEKYGIDIQ